MPNKNDIGKAFETLKSWIFRKHNGVLLMRKNTGWQIYDTNRWHPTWEDAVKDVDERRRQVVELIKKQNRQ